jgi:hypothetical protein
MFVSAEINASEAGLGSVVTNIRRWMGDVAVPANCRWDIGGHYLQQQEAFRSLTVVMIVAVLLVYLMLAVQFRSLMLPLLIFLEQPLSLVSGLFALWITNTPLNVSSYMGAILLIGLDMKNGILLVEYIQQLRGEGMALRPALLLAGQMRLRPILMTSLAAILGLFPLALGIGPGAQMQQPLAIMVISNLCLRKYNNYGQMAIVYLALLLPVVFGMLVRRRPRAWSVVAGALATSVTFFVVTNFAEWAFYDLYPHTAAGLVEGYAAAIPFFRNTLVSDMLFSGLIFGTYWLAVSSGILVSRELKAVPIARPAPELTNRG